ncbi:MAG TPA: phosphatidate cytidylyltransferase [Chloroflexota bacterium]|nr:phosphatidate cytidylyltransferase [Chloroflexota bacterium]
MLAARVASALVLAPLTLYATWRGGGVYVLVVAAAAALGAFELCRLFEKGGFRPAWPLALAGAAALAAAPAAPDAHLGGLAAALLVLGPGIYLLAEGAPVQRALYDWSQTTFAGLVVGWPLAQAVALRWAAGEARLWGTMAERGVLLALVALTCTWASDTVAYAVGRLVGRRPFFPLISPRKSVEGAVGGVVAPAGVGLAWAGALGWPAAFAVVLGASVGVAAICGDLLESMLKRSVGAKDSGALIPGHGGLLDRIDGLLLALVAVALLTGEAWP